MSALTVKERRQLLPLFAKIQQGFGFDSDLCWHLSQLMLKAGYLTEEASNPTGALFQGDAP